MLSRNFGTSSNIIWFSVFFGLLLVSAGFFFLRILPVIGEARLLSGQLESMISQRRQLVSRREGPPSEALLRAAKEASALKEEMLKDFEEEISIEVPGLLPEGIVRPSIYWLDTLGRKRPEITERAARAGLAIPAGLGFDDRLPDDERVPLLLFRLHIIEELIDIAARSGLRSVSALNFGESAKAAGLEDFGIEKLPLGFSVRASISSLFSFIHLLRDANFIYVIEDMKFNVVDRERVETRRPQARTRTRTPEHFDMFEMPVEEVPETRIRERFLEVEMRVSMYYIPAREQESFVPDEAPRRRSPDFDLDGELNGIPGDPVERSRMFR